jgi:hypothetical protein
MDCLGFRHTQIGPHTRSGKSSELHYEQRCITEPRPATQQTASSPFRIRQSSRTVVKEASDSEDDFPTSTACPRVGIARPLQQKVMTIWEVSIFVGGNTFQLRLTPVLAPAQLTGVPLDGLLPTYAPGQLFGPVQAPGAPLVQPPVK